MGLVGSALEFGVELNADEEIIAGNLNGFNKSLIGRSAADNKTCVYHFVSEIVVEFVAVAVTLVNDGRVVALFHLSAVGNAAGIAAEPESAALVDILVLVGHEVDDLVGA